MSGPIRKAMQGGRLVSPSVRAAEGLPPTIKTQSVKNQLIRGGAKPVELEYADFDHWLSRQRGDSVRSSDVARYLEQQGPMGRMQRLDAQGDDIGDAAEDYFYPEDDETAYYNVEAAKDMARDKPPDERKFTEAQGHYSGEQRERTPSPIEKPFSGRWAYWPYTQHGAYTESDAWGWSPMDYREAMWGDPRSNRRIEPLFSPNADPKAVDTHAAHIWVRYHNNPDALDVQNIQSDLGQNVERAASERVPKGKDAEIAAGYQDLLKRRRADLQNAQIGADEVSQELVDKYGYLVRSENPERGNWAVDKRDIASLLSVYMITSPEVVKHLATTAQSERVRNTARWVLGLDANDMSRLIGAHAHAHRLDEADDKLLAMVNRYNRSLTARGINPHPDLSAATGSPILDSSAWRQIPLRHLLLESAVQDGKPIRFPLGINVTAVENMPRSGARRMYDVDMPRAMEKLMRSIGGGEVRRVPGVSQKTVEYYDHIDDKMGKYNLRVGPQGQRAGTIAIPSQKTVDHIKKYGLDFLSLLLMAGAGSSGEQAAPQQNTGPVTGELLR